MGLNLCKNAEPHRATVPTDAYKEFFPDHGLLLLPEAVAADSAATFPWPLLPFLSCIALL
jgi:hypothetical protein